MKKELDYFTIGSSYGGQQDWYPEYMLRIGGCALTTACDCSIYFKKHLSRDELCPLETDDITKEEYIRFALTMKPYLRPRMGGIDRLSLYREGYGNYLSDVGCRTITMAELEGHRSVDEAEQTVIGQIEAKMPVPYLMLHHKNRALRDYDWHWFLLTGFDERDDGLYVKTVTYGEWHWLRLRDLWETGYRRKGGMILFAD